MRSKFSFIILVVTFMLLSSLQIGASPNTVQSDSGLVIEKRPLTTPLPPPSQPTTSQDKTPIQEAFTAALSNDPTASLVKTKVEGQWAYGIIERSATDRLIALAHALPNGTWQVALPDDDTTYSQWLAVLPETLIPLAEKEALRAKLEVTFPLVQSTLDWETFTDPYWAFTVSYPADWGLQNIPYKDFGVRIGSPNLEVDRLGHPTQGSFLSASVVPMTLDKWANYKTSLLVDGEILDAQVLPFSKGEGKQITRLDRNGNHIIERIFYIDEHFYRFRFVQTINDASILLIGHKMLASIRLVGNPEEYPQVTSENWLAESRFVYAPSIDTFDIQQWLDHANSSVGNCYFETGDDVVNYSSLINKISEETGINPRVLLVMSEITHGIVSNPSLGCGVLQGYEKELLEVAMEMMQATATFSSKHIDDQAIETLYTYSRLNTAVNNSSFGIAIGIAINAVTYHESPYELEKQFYDTYATYFGDSKTIAPYMQPILENLNSVTFLMPFIDRRTYSGGPHGVGHPPSCNDTPVGETSGIDFGGGVDANDPFNTAVIAIADGTVVGIKDKDNPNPAQGQGGRWVAIQHSNNIVSMYWHLSSINPNLEENQNISSGAYLGEIGNSGLPSGDPAHIHLELRTGGSDYSTWAGKGSPVPWTGVEIDEWRIYPEVNAQGFAEGYNGSAVRSAISTTSKNISTNCGWVDARVENGFPYTNETNTATTVFAFVEHKTWFQSSNSPNCPEQNTLTFQINASSLCGGGALNPPQLVSPNNGEILDNRAVNFAWQSPNSPNQTGYTFRLNTSANPDTQPWIVDTGLGNEYISYDHTFSADSTFYWHMRTWNSGGESSAWVTRQFHIDTSSQSDEVMLCGTDNASSDCWFFPTGVYSDLSAWGLNDWARSVVVPSGKSVFLFREGGLRGTAECYSGDRIPLPSGDPWDLRGQVTGVQTFNQSNCPTSQLYSVVMYDNQNYGSHHWGIGYNEGIHNLNQIGGPDDLYFNDRGESVRIPNGWSIRLYEHNDRGGQASGCLTGAVSSLGSLNNTVSSVEIFHNSACTPPTPTPPSNLSVSSTTDNSISLAWQDNSSNETSFKIYRWGWNGTAWDFLYLDSVAANITSYTDTGLNCGETDYYTVSAVNNGSESAQAGWVQGNTAVCPTVEITDAWTGDGNWSPQSTFDPGDSIQWVLTIVNTTGADADIDVSYDVYGPTGEHVLNWNGILTVSNGGWNFGLPGTVADGLGGTNSFDGLGNYQGHITFATTTYISTGPTQINVGTEQNGNQVTLTWAHQPQNTTYEVWHSPSPYFTPGDSGSNKLTTVTAPTSEFIVNAVGFYKVKSLNATGEVVSNEVGIFNFPISPGELPNPTYNWSLVNPSTKPSARAGVALAVNTNTNKLVLFGGTCAGFACDDTWVYDGNSWQELDISGPSPRENARMVYDSLRQRIVLFGGHVWAGTHLNDTWEFDGNSWSQINTNNTPLGRSNQAMTYDPVRGKVIMFGGWRGTQIGNDILSDTWEYNGTDWTQISTTHSPPANAGSWMSYIPDWNQAIMSVRNSTQQYNATWAYDGADWTQIGTPTVPRRYNYQMAYNPIQQRLVLFGGYDVLYHTGAYADTWEFDGQQWVEATPTTSPPATWASEAVYYAPLNGVVMFGGNSPNQNDLVDTMWLYAPGN